MKLKVYFWRAINHLKEQQKGSLIAENQQQAHQILLQRGLQNIKLQRNWQFSYKVKQTEVCALFTQLSILLNASLPLKSCLQLLLQGCTNISLYQWLQNLIASLNSGLSFSQALEKEGKYLTYQEMRLILVGEMTGQLASLCEQIAANKEQQLRLQKKIQKILLYPMVVLSISLILTGLLLIFIVPQFAQMYGDNQTKLPLFTHILLQLSSFLQHYLWPVIAILFIVIFLVRFQYKHSNKFKILLQKIIQKIPLLNHMNQLGRLVSFCRSLGLMLQAGIPLNQALATFLERRTNVSVQRIWHRKNLASDWLLQQYVQQMLQGIEQGFPLSANLSSHLFSEQDKQMLQIGESSGKLSMMLEHIANYQQQNLDHQIDLLSQLLEPMLMLIIGLLIGMIMLGMYLPIFNMGALIQ